MIAPLFPGCCMVNWASRCCPGLAFVPAPARRRRLAVSTTLVQPGSAFRLEPVAATASFGSSELVGAEVMRSACTAAVGGKEAFPICGPWMPVSKSSRLPVEATTTVKAPILALPLITCASHPVCRASSPDGGVARPGVTCHALAFPAARPCRRRSLSDMRGNIPARAWSGRADRGRGQPT